METLEENKNRFFKIVFVLIVILSVYFAVRIFSEIKKDSMLGESTTPNTISFDGTGDVSAAPDLATISFSIVEDAPVMADAQTKATAKETAVLSFLNTSGIAKADITTENYSSYPQYEYSNSVCPQVEVGVMGSSAPVYCPPGKQVLTGYEVSENISVKVHDITKAGDIVKGIGTVGISNMNGPNYSIDNQDALQEQARKIAIDDAKAKAQTLAKDLGVSLVRVVNFSENGNNPIAYPQVMMASGASVNASAPAPALPTGENKITSNVTITYEIR